MGFFVFGQIAGLIEIVIVLRFLIRFFRWKEEVHYRRIITAGACGLLLMIAQMNGSFRFSHILVVLLDVIILFVFCRWFLKGTFQFQLLGCITPFLIVTMCNIVIMQIMSLYKECAVQWYMKTQGISFVAGVIMSKILLAFFLQWVLKSFEDTNLHLSKKSYHIINVVCIYMVIMEFLLFYVINMEVYHRKTNILLGVISIGMAVTSIYIGYSVYVISRKNAELMKYKLSELQNQERERQIQEIERAKFRENQLIHDYKNHCICVRKLLEKKHYKEAERYLSEMIGKQILQKEEFVHTGNTVLDALINSKIAYCADKDIPIHCIIIGAVKNIEKMEILVILFNLLDNAIEASEKLEKKGRDIEVELYCNAESMELFVKNNIAQSVLLENPRLLTKKEKQEEHGIGHLSVEASVEELDGVMEYFEEQGKFCAHVFVPLPDL